MGKYIMGHPGGKKTRTGVKYYEIFKTRFWETPGEYYNLFYSEIRIESHYVKYFFSERI